MLAYYQNHGVALIPNPPKERYSCPYTGAHFEYKEIYQKLEKIAKLRIEEYKKSTTLNAASQEVADK